jgi:hypothetical protein
MKNTFFKITTLLAVAALFFGACQKEYLNPSTADEQEVVKDVNGLIALCNGLQYRYTVGRQSPMYTTVCANGFTTLELDILNAGNTDENFLSIGGSSVVGNNAVVTNLWEQNNLIKSNADLVLRNAGNAGEAATRSGIVAYASIFKALALGNLATFWEQAPIAVQEKATFNSREELLREAVRLLNEAASQVAANPISATNFTAKTAGGIDVANAIQALIARYSLMLGDYAGALTAANKVDLTKKSEFKYDEISRNPIYDVSLSNVNVFQPADSVLGLPAGLQPAAADGRVLFYLKSKTPSATNVYSGKGFWTANGSPIPVYLPGEILLLKAECLARQDQVTEAIAELDKVLTKKAADDVFGVAANLPAYAGAQTKEAVLEEIYRNRCIELFMSGLKLEDSRRFGRVASATVLTERNRNFYPYPFNERDNNPNTPPDPTF